MHANNELGTVQPVAEIARITRAAGVPLHVDGVQALGKIPVDVEALGVDLYSMSAHKLYAPKGVGALYVRKGTRLAPLRVGRASRARAPAGDGERGRDRRLRSGGGTGRGAAWRRMRNAWAALRDRLESAALERIPGVAVNGSRWHRTPNTSNHLFRRHRRRSAGDRARPARLRGFDAARRAPAAPSRLRTCSPPSGFPPDRARASMRFSLGRANTAAQVDALVEALAGSVAHLRRISVHA